ncbi:zf-HC2 domain-containing protein [Oceanirhabdus sp. W0125-5]|uniref:zf-HC2 domain-containing protein n=1 Tax=Oceanirhabdus sp. W0125-5 TaxID=2999116 RepID=UPI0022F3155E|nr:zf-HC2 domain-containing protein [Oceanirhabdus sp. W0125-5]WBW98046.1 zf-HC2 domain-containing protein [Oceanirhabdus sp. W0125-5]
MKCNEVLQHLSEYIENDLDERLMEEISNHIEACSECNKAYEEEKAINDMFLEVLNSEPIEFNSRIKNVMNMIDKQKYSSQKEENHVIEDSQEEKVIKFESVNKKKEKKLLFNKKIIAVAATFSIMIFMAPFMIREQNKDMDFAIENKKDTKTFEEAKYDGYKADERVSEKDNSKEESTASVAGVEEDKKEAKNSDAKQEVGAVQAYDDVNNDSNTEVSLMKDDTEVRMTKGISTFNYAGEYNVKYLKNEHNIVFNNDDGRTTIKINEQEEDLGIQDCIIINYVEDGQWVYIASVGKDIEKGEIISKIIKVNTKTNEIDIMYTSLIKETIIDLQIEKENLNFIIKSNDMEKNESIKK